jgi:hypothetical protein
MKLFLLILLSATVGYAAQIPIAPSSLTANAAATNQIALAWVDNSYNENGFIVERSLNSSSGPWSRMIVTLANITNYTDTSSDAFLKTCFYRVASYNSSGKSAYSAVAIYTPCSVFLDQTLAHFNSAGGSAIVMVDAQSGCAWSATNSVPWIQLSNTNGTGDGYVRYVVSNNTNQARSGAIIFSGQTLTVTQESGVPDCNYTLSSVTNQFDRMAATGTIGVTVYTNGCQWTARTDSDWITLTGTNIGTWDGFLTYAVSLNEGFGRAGNIIVAGITSAVVQAGIVAVPDGDAPVFAEIAATVTISGTAIFKTTTNNNNSTTNVSWFVDGSTLLGSDASPPYELSYDTTGIADGSHSFSSKVYVSGGTIITSEVVTATVMNVVPTNGPWAIQFGNGGVDRIYSTAISPVDNSIVVAGTYEGNVNYGGGLITNAGGVDMVLAKFSAAGVHQWSKGFGSDSNDFGAKIAIDAVGNVYFGNSFHGNASYGGTVFTNHSANTNRYQVSDFVISKFSPSGSNIWSKQFGSTNSEQVAAIALDSQTNVIVVGSFVIATDLGGGLMFAEYGGFNSFVMKLSPAGTFVWARTFGSTADDFAAAVAVDSADNIVVGGFTGGPMDWGGGFVVQNGNLGYLTKMTSGGGYIWGQFIGGGQQLWSASVIGLAINGSNNIVATGTLNNGITLCGTQYPANGFGDTWLGKFAPDGTCVWGKTFGGNQTESPASVAFDPGGNIILSGTFQNTINLGGGVLQTTTYGAVNTYIGKFNPAGTHIWSQRFTGDGLNSPFGLATDSGSKVVLVGSFDHTCTFNSSTFTAIETNYPDAFMLRLNP